ncbi:MAG: cob(I)yrinic acid a,c-diamide adenosyltransferase [Panacagrimonas sp.]
MGNRLSKIVTRTGDAGTTGLTDGSRIPKQHLRVCAMGDVDELNSQLGVVLTHPLPEEIHARLISTQQLLFNLGGELSMPGYQLVKDSDVIAFDEALEALNETLPPLKDFIMPGGSPASAACHVARTVARRAERATWALHAVEPLNAPVMMLLNRLSDYLFVVSRVLGRGEGAAETTWKRGGRSKPQGDDRM